MPARTAGTFAEHLRELRLRLFASFLFFVAGGVLAYVLNVPILHAIQLSLHQPLYYTTPAGAFNLAMKISFIGGAVFALPAIMYNVAAFVQPALDRKLARLELRLMTALTLVLAAGGAAFAYYLVVPMSLSFFQKFDVKGFQSLISATEYVGFVVNCILIFVLLFQLPLFMLLIDRVRPLPPKRLWKFEKYVVIGSLIIALVLPFTYDPLTQFLIALPIILLYNLSILLIMLSHHAQRRRGVKLFAKPATDTQQVRSASAPIPMPSVATMPAAVPVHQAVAPQTPRTIDGFIPQSQSKKPPADHNIRRTQPKPSAALRQRPISDFINQPIKRQIHYQPRQTPGAPLPRRVDLSGFVVNPAPGSLQQPSAET